MNGLHYSKAQRVRVAERDRLSVEIRNGRHTRPTGFLGDVEKYNTATLYGWRLFRVTPSRLISASTMQLLHDAITLKYVKSK